MNNTTYAIRQSKTNPTTGVYQTVGWERTDVDGIALELADIEKGETVIIFTEEDRGGYARMTWKIMSHAEHFLPRSLTMSTDYDGYYYTGTPEKTAHELLANIMKGVCINADVNNDEESFFEYLNLCDGRYLKQLLLPSG